MYISSRFTVDVHAQRSFCYFMILPSTVSQKKEIRVDKSNEYRTGSQPVDSERRRLLDSVWNSALSHERG